jgi:hypothetical protein
MYWRRGNPRQVVQVLSSHLIISCPFLTYNTYKDELDSCCTCDQQKKEKGLQECSNVYSLPRSPAVAAYSSDDGAGVGVLLAEDGGEPVGVSGDPVDALAHRRRVVAPVLPGEVLVPPRRRLPPRQRRRRVPEQVRGHRWTCLTTVLLSSMAWRVLLLLRLTLLLFLRRGRLGAEPDAAAGLLVLASSRTFWRLWLGRWRRILRCFLLLGLGLRRRRGVVMIGLFLFGWCLLRLLLRQRLWCALLLLLLLLRRRRRCLFLWDHVDVVVAGEGHRPHVVGLQGRVRHRVVQPLFPPSLAPCT